MFKRTMLSVAACATVILAAPVAQATTYYVNNASWGDTNSGTTTSAPWRTVAKVNMAPLVAGDTVLFAAYGTWDETLIVKDGVTYGSYNTGNKPIIRGSRYVGGLTWTRTSPTSNIWWATTTSAIETGAISQLYLNGTRLQRARHPNVGTFGANSRYAPVAQSATDIETLYLNQNPDHLSPFPLGNDSGVAGALAYVRVNNSDLNEYTVTGWKTGAAPALKVAGINIIEGWNYWHQVNIGQDWGYWLENKLWMLDAASEWYFDAANHRLHVWMPNGASPQGQQLYAASQAGIKATGVSNFTINNIEVRETVGDAVSIKGGSNATLGWLDIIRPGSRGIAMTETSGNSIHHANIQDSVRDGIWLGDPRGDIASIPATDTSITYSTVNNAGKGFRAHSAIMLGNGGLTSNNVITNSSYIGILASKPATIQNNLVKNSCLNFGDCGGIYIGGLANGAVLNSVVEKNIVDGGTGSSDGAPAANAYSATETRGIYLDDYVNTVTVTGNFVTGMRQGFMLHSAKNITLTQNTAFKNEELGLLMQEDVANTMVNNLVTQNVFLSTQTNYPNLKLASHGGVGNNGNFAAYNQNRYVATNSPSVVYNFVYSGGTQVLGQAFTLPTWQQATGQDLGSSFKLLSQDNESAFAFYNPANAAATTASCPSAIPARCAAFVDLKTNLPVSFPIQLPANSFVTIGR